MIERYSPRNLAIIGTCLVAVITIITLFVPPYIGYSNDGSFDSVMADCGLKHISATDEDRYFNYYCREYYIDESTYKPNTTSIVVKTFVKTAIMLDTLLSPDNVFDIRALAALYVIFYLPMLYVFLRYLLGRVQLFTEGVVIMVLAVLIFSDVSLISRFASFYTSPIIAIALLALVGSSLYFAQHELKMYPMVTIVLSDLVLISVNPYCFMAGLFFTIIALMLFDLTKKRVLWRVGCVLCALVLSASSFFGLSVLMSQNSPTRLYHAMTRGVLLQASNPEEQLAEFNISPRFSVLTDTYGDQQYPVVIPESGFVDEGFLDQYSTGDILAYYLRHPTSLVAMLDIGIRASFDTRPSYSGNYEKSLGMLPRAKALFLSLWSTFKSQSAPRTIGFFIVLTVGMFLLFRRRTLKQIGDQSEKQSAYMARVIMVLASFALAQMATIILISGDAELPRESFVMGMMLDVFILIVFSEILHKLNIIGTGRRSS